MDIERLQEFLLIAQNHSFKQTAQTLKVSEAVLSARINTLEKNLGIRLFQRNAHKVALTAKGLQFLPDATQIVASFHQLQQRISSISYNTYRNLRFAFSGTKITHGIPTLAARQAIELPAFPVLAPHSTAAPISRARTSATAPARSLNDALGFCPSSFKNRFFSPRPAPSRGVL